MDKRPTTFASQPCFASVTGEKFVPNPCGMLVAPPEDQRVFDILAERIAETEAAFEAIDWLEVISTDSHGIESVLADNSITYPPDLLQITRDIARG